MRLGIVHTWGAGPEVVFLSNPVADPVSWSAGVRDELLQLGYRVTTFEHRPAGLDWGSAVGCVTEFVARRREPVALVGWSQGAALAQEVALASPETVSCAALLATYGRQNEIDKTLQQSWDRLAYGDDDLASLRLALTLLTAFPRSVWRTTPSLRLCEQGKANGQDAPTHSGGSGRARSSPPTRTGCPRSS